MKIFPIYPRSNYDRIKNIFKIMKDAQQTSEKQAKRILKPLISQKKG